MELITRSRLSRLTGAGVALALGLAATGCGSAASQWGNVDIEDVSNYYSVGFILDDGEYSFFAMPDASWTRIIGVDASAGRALVWFRDDSDTGYEPAVLDLEESEFATLTIDELDGFFARGLTTDGRVVGGVSGDDLVYGVVYDLDTAEVSRVERPGSDFTGVSDANGDALLGYTDAGMATFVSSGDDIIDVHGDGANRLLGNQMNGDGVIVGFASWHDDPMWDPLNRGFVATPGEAGYTAEPFALTGMARTTITGINDAGRIAGHVHEHADTPLVAYSADVDAPDETLTLHPLPDAVTAHLSTPGTGASVWGIDADGRLFGTVFITDPEPELWAEEEVCGGHGHLHGTECHCDSGYVQDEDDPGMCLLDET